MPSGDGADLARLCQSCGMCCDGSLFGRVRLAPEEVEGARRRGLRVLPSGGSLEQPCAALVTSPSGAGPTRICSAYDERPQSCRAFACRLYERHRREGGPLDDRLAVVRRVRELLASLEGLRLGPDAYAELKESLDRDFSRA
jgi:hypothetical protein